MTKDEEEQKEDEELFDDVEPPCIQQALDTTKLLEKYLLCHDLNLFQDMAKIHRKIQEKYWQSKLVQTKMTDYFE